MKKLFFVLAAVLLLAGCKGEDIAYTPNTLEGEPSLTDAEELSPTAHYPKEDGGTVTVEPIFPDEYPPKISIDVALSHYGWGDHLPVISYKDNGQERIAVLDNNMQSLAEGTALYEKAKEYLSLEAAEPYDAFYLDSAEKGYTETLVYTADKSRLVYKLRLPFEYRGNKYYLLRDNTRTKEYDGCTLKQVFPNGRLLLEVGRYRHKSVYDGKTYHNVIEKKPSTYLYDVATKKYTPVAREMEHVSMSPDMKHYVAAEGQTLYICQIGSVFRSVLGDKEQELSVLSWVNKEELYTAIGEEMPILERGVIPYASKTNFPQKPSEVKDPEDTPDDFIPPEATQPDVTPPEVTTYELGTATDKTETVTVGLHKDASSAPFVIPESCDPDEIDLSKYLPYLRGTQEVSGEGAYLSAARPQGAFIADGVSTLDEGKAIYNRVNDRYSQSDRVSFDGNVTYLDPMNAELLIDVSRDMSRAVIYENGNYKYYTDRKLTGSKYGSVYLEKEILEEKAPVYDVEYSAEGRELYRDETTVIFADQGKLQIYSRDTLELLRTVDFSYQGDPASVTPYSYYIARANLLEVVDGRYVFVEYPRYIYTAGGCTCGMRVPDDSVLCKYDLVTDEYELIANHYQSYSISPDGRYVAYTYNDISTENEGDLWYELFVGCICIRDVQSGKTLVLPFEVKSYYESALPSTLWTVGEWVEADKLNETLSLPAKDFTVYDGITLTLPDGGIPTKQIKLSEAKDNWTEHNGSVSFGDYLPMIKYPFCVDGKTNFYRYSILSDSTDDGNEGASNIENGTELYDSINAKYSERLPIPEDITADSNNDLLGDKLFMSHLEYLSPRLDTAVILTYKDKGKKGESTHWEAREWTSQYETVRNGEKIGSVTIDGISDRLYEPEKVYDNVYRLEIDGSLYPEIYRDDNWIVFIKSSYEQISYYVYSVKEARFLYTVAYDDPYRYGLSIDKITSDGGLVIKSWEKVYLYNVDTEGCLYIGDHIDYLFSPDMKYVIYTDLDVAPKKHSPLQYSFCIKDIENEKLYVVKTYQVDISKMDPYAPYPSPVLLSWLERDALEEKLK